MKTDGFCRGLRANAALLLVVMALLPSGAAQARLAGEVVDLRTAPSWLVTGASEMGPVGDVNGDGVPDVAVSDCGADERAGEVRVVWGPFERDDVSFERLGDGFSILGAESGDVACRFSMRPVGDVDGDGLDDVLVAAERDYRSPATVYVVFGKSDSDTVHLRDFDAGTQGDQGYVVRKWNGWYVAVDALGDMNHDGLADFVVGGWWGGKTYVVFGQSSPLPVDLRTFDLGLQGDRGFVITNRCRECVFGAVGDVDGDGVSDVGVGGVGWKRYEAPGSAYVVFGKSDALPVDTTKGRTHQFFKIKGDSPGGLWNGALAPAGDVDGDGLGDVIVGFPKSYSCCHGKVAVVFGKTDTDTVRLADLGDRGFQIFAGQEGDNFGAEATGIGDVDGDGFDDIAVGAYFHSPPGRGATGGVFVIYGRRTPTDLRTSRLGNGGYLVAGQEEGDWTGWRVGAPGDVNGDGVPDVMITAGGDKAFLLWL